MAALMTPLAPAQEAEPACPEGTAKFDTPPVSEFGAGFVCLGPTLDLFCPPGYELRYFQTPEETVPACVAVVKEAGKNLGWGDCAGGGKAHPKSNNGNHNGQS